MGAHFPPTFNYARTEIARAGGGSSSIDYIQLYKNGLKQCVFCSIQVSPATTNSPDYVDRTLDVSDVYFLHICIYYIEGLSAWWSSLRAIRVSNFSLFPYICWWQVSRLEVAMEESCQQHWVCPHGGARLEAGDTWIDRPSGRTCHCVQVHLQN